MQLVLNPKQVNTLRSYPEEEIIEFEGILNSTYKSAIDHSPRDSRSFLSVKKRLYKNQLRFTQNVEVILKLSVFTAILLAVII